MIIEMLLNVIMRVVSLLMVFEIPKMPPEVTEYVNTAFDYIVGAVGIVANYCPLSYFVILFGLILAVDAGIMIYHFVMWIIKKIPMLGMS